MKKLAKWLENNGIAFELTKNGYIVITLKKDCVWINGYGKEMLWDNKISIYKNTYSEYVAYENTGYMLGKTIFHGSRVDNLIKILNGRLLEQ